MFSRPMLFVGILIAAAAVPYILLDEQLANSARGQWDRLMGGADEEKDDLLDALHTANSHYKTASGVSSGTPLPTIEQALRFDLTPQWVISRWPAVSTVAGEPDELGMRVAWVSGTRPDDVAGSLTYYFDAHHRLQRITVTGLTGDPRRLLSAVVVPYGLKSQPTTDAAYYIAGDPHDPTSEVIVSHPLPSGSAGEAAHSEVTVDLRRPDTARSSAGKPKKEEPKLVPSSYRRWSTS